MVIEKHCQAICHDFYKCFFLGSFLTFAETCRPAEHPLTAFLCSVHPILFRVGAGSYRWVGPAGGSILCTLGLSSEALNKDPGAGMARLCLLNERRGRDSSGSFLRAFICAVFFSGWPGATCIRITTAGLLYSFLPWPALESLGKGLGI